MPFWMCSTCGTCVEATESSDECPHCKEKCTFRDVTCYRPDCGGEKNPDPVLTRELMRDIKGHINIDYSKRNV